MKKIVAAVAVLMFATAFAGCVKNNGNDANKHTEHEYVYQDLGNDNHRKSCKGCEDIDITEAHTYADNDDLTCNLCGHTRDWFDTVSLQTKANLSADGYVKDKISDFSQYVGTSAYRKVSTAEELIEAIKDARYDYTTTWVSNQEKTDEEIEAEKDIESYDGTLKQQLNREGSVHVIEITQDLNLGYYKLTDEAKNDSYVEDYCRKNAQQIKDFTMSDMFTENGISKIKIEKTSNLLVYSKNGAKLTHGGFSILSCNNVVFRNLEMDEMWQWEDTANASTGAVGDCDAFGWAYFKVSHSGYVWIDHCTFGKSYDGQIDYSNPVSYSKKTAFRAPYGYDGKNGLHISWCKFNAGSDDNEGYLYKMMAAIEEDYQNGGKNYLYYNALRDGGISFKEILYGIAIPQKKGFLCGDSGNNKEDYDYNLNLQISFSNCYFKNFEDRIPKLRGGNAYMYNCLVDSFNYYTYRNTLRSKNAASLVSAVNNNSKGGWKCALVSQGIVCGNGGSFYAENCAFKGIDSLLKNNDSGGTTEGDKVRPVNAGYKLVNCSYQQTAKAPEYVGSSSDTGASFPNSSSGTLKPENFAWHTENKEKPFEISAIALDNLEAVLSAERYGAGVNKDLQDRLLKSRY